MTAKVHGRQFTVVPSIRDIAVAIVTAAIIGILAGGISSYVTLSVATTRLENVEKALDKHENRIGAIEGRMMDTGGVR